MNPWRLAAVVVAIIFAVSASAVSPSQQSDIRILGFDPGPPVASRSEASQLTAAAPAASRVESDSTSDRPPPTNARIIVSILALVISTVIMYFWAKSLRKPKARPAANPQHGVAPSTSPHAQSVTGRRAALRIVMAAACVAMLFPPFYFQGAGGSRFGLGHSFILLPPRIGEGAAYYGSVDAVALLAILAGIALVAWISDRSARGD